MSRPRAATSVHSKTDDSAAFSKTKAREEEFEAGCQKIALPEKDTGI